MKSKFHIIVAVACLAILTACGGGSKKSDPVVVPQPAYAIKDVTVGPGADTTTLAEKGDLVTVAYTGYLYNAAKPDGIGDKVESSIDSGTTAPPFTLGVGGIVPSGWDLATVGMRVGGVRLATLPANLAYGDSTRPAQSPYAAIPANSPLVYELRLINVTKVVKQPSVPAPTDLKIVEVTAGTGAVAALGKSVTVRYSGYFYDGTRESLKGARFDPGATATAPYGTLTFTVGTVTGTGSVIPGFTRGTEGMLVGGKRTVFIPPALGYGATGSGTTIPPNANLVFDIELMSVN